jgi:hypothetical protein
VNKKVLGILSVYILRAFLCFIFIALGNFVIAVAIPFDIIWFSGFILVGLGLGGIIIQLFFSFRETRLDNKFSELPTKVTKK